VHDFSLIGMGAIILDNARIGPYSLVAARAVVVGNSIIPEGMLAAGVPAKAVRPLTDEERQIRIHSPRNYVDYAASYGI
jgi:carbonic anhydrase/acetyltransferase-like protein (isoleucine patch superfamily)